MHSLQRGVTLIELLIATCVVAILAGIAMPAFSGALEESHSSTARAALLASYLSAVDGATASGSHAVLCPSIDGNTCLGEPDWSGGWIVFLDGDGDYEHQAGESIIAQHGALAGKVRLHSTIGRTKIVIQPSGGNAGSNVTYTLCDGRGAALAESLVLSNRGLLHAGVPTAAAIAATCTP
jgi:type IV fimbrial biogenesis protein FimT